MPNPSLTPGAIFPEATRDKVCAAGYSKSVRDVPPSEKNAVYVEYGIASHTPNSFEVDHLISLELGGSNDVTNLWPEPYNDPAGAHVKDRLENWLHDQVCSGKIELTDAQHRIASNWYQAWLDAGRP